MILGAFGLSANETEPHLTVFGGQPMGLWQITKKADSLMRPVSQHLGNNTRKRMQGMIDAIDRRLPSHFTGNVNIATKSFEISQPSLPYFPMSFNAPIRTNSMAPMKKQ